jgi:hypothetical protein
LGRFSMITLCNKCIRVVLPLPGVPVTYDRLESRIKCEKEVPVRGVFHIGVGTEHQPCARVDQFVLQVVMSAYY